jgi:PKD repeat protein
MALADQAKEHAKSFAMKFVGGVIGLISAGVLMWFTPLIDRFIKPPQPIANFETVESGDGLNVTFKNLSQNAKEARWDFGDGSPLQILPGTQAEVEHKYKKANSYTVTLIVKNVSDQEDKRVNSIAVGVKPQLLDVHVKGIQQKEPFTAPAQLKFIATADMDESKFEWDFGKGTYQPGSDTETHTFNRPGKHTIRVRAVVGNTKSVPQIKVVELLSPSGVVPAGAVEPAPSSQPASSSPGSEGAVAPANSPTIDVAVRITNAPENMGDVKSRMVVVNEKATGSEVVQTYKAKAGYLITKVDLDKATITTSPNLINLHAETVDNGAAVKVKAQVTTPGADVKMSVLLTYEEVRNPTLPKESTCTLSVPGSGTVDQPVGRKYEFEVRAKGVTILKQSDLPAIPVSFTLDGRYFLISTATAPGARLQIIVRETPRRLPS